MTFLGSEPCRLDAVLHFVLCDFGQLGRAFVETSPENANREAVIRDIVSGQYDRPLRVLAVDPAAGWSSDVTSCRRPCSITVLHGQGVHHTPPLLPSIQSEGA